MVADCPGPSLHAQKKLCPLWLKSISCFVLGGGVLFLDLTFPNTPTICLLYSLVVLGAWWVPSRYATLVAATICSIFILLGAMATQTISISVDMFNRGLALFVIWTLVVVLMRTTAARQEWHSNQTNLEDAIQQRDRKLTDTYARLEESMTRQQKTEQELADLKQTVREQNQELEMIVSVASHDFRSPLVNVQGFSRELARSYQRLHAILDAHKLAPSFKQEVLSLLESDISESLHHIQAGAKKMETLLRGLLRFSRLGRLTLHIERLDMNAMMASIVMGMEYQLKEKGVSIQIEDLPSCAGDATLVNQLFCNLLDNAHKYLDPNRPGIIRVKGVLDNGHAVIGVEDNGIGIPQSEQSRVFEMFQRLDRSSGSGEGLGLAIVRRIVERHKGTIRMESTPGQGTTFLIALPAAHG